MSGDSAFDSRNKSFSGSPFHTEEPLKSEQLKSTKLIQESLTCRSDLLVSSVSNKHMPRPTDCCILQLCVFQSLADIAAKSFGSIERLSCCWMKLVTSRASFVAGGCCWRRLEHVPEGLTSSSRIPFPNSLWAIGMAHAPVALKICGDTCESPSSALMLLPRDTLCFYVSYHSVTGIIHIVSYRIISYHPMFCTKAVNCIRHHKYVSIDACFPGLEIWGSLPGLCQPRWVQHHPHHHGSPALQGAYHLLNGAARLGPQKQWWNSWIICTIYIHIHIRF